MRNILIYIFASIFFFANPAFSRVNSTGSPTNVVTRAGSLTSGNCVQATTNNQIVTTGSPCGGGGGGITSITSNNGSLTINNTDPSNPDVFLNLSNSNTWSVDQTFGAGIHVDNIIAPNNFVIQSSNANPGFARIRSGASGAPNGDNLSVTAGDGSGAEGNGGNLLLSSGGAGGDNSLGGDLILSSGSGTVSNSAPGSIYMQPGNGGVDLYGGDVIAGAGDGGSASGNGGGVTFYGGGSNNGNGGNVTFFGGYSLAGGVDGKIQFSQDRLLPRYAKFDLSQIALYNGDNIFTWPNIGGANGYIQTVPNTGFGRVANQTGAVTVLGYTTPEGADGSYTLSLNANVISGSSYDFSTNCSYFDENNVSSDLLITFQDTIGDTLFQIDNVNGTGAFASFPYHIKIKADTTITCSTSGTFTSVLYNMEAALTKLQ